MNLAGQVSTGILITTSPEDRMSQNACPARLMLLQSIHTVTSNARSASGLGRVDNSGCEPIAAATPEALAAALLYLATLPRMRQCVSFYERTYFPEPQGPRCNLACIIMMRRSTLIGYFPPPGPECSFRLRFHLSSG